MSESKNLDRWMPKVLALNQPVEIPLHPEIRKQIEDQEKEAADRIKALQTENLRLSKTLTEANNKLASIESLVYFKDKLSVYCPQTNVKITILQCAERIRRGHCKGCLDRDAILKQLEAP